MFVRACLHGFVLFCVMQFVPILLQASQGPALELGGPFDALMQSSMQWVAALTTLGAWLGLGMVFLSGLIQMLSVEPSPGQPKPVTWRDQFALAAEQDSAILYAKHVITYLDEAIANRWPDQKDKG